MKSSVKMMTQYDRVTFSQPRFSQNFQFSVISKESPSPSSLTESNNSSSIRTSLIPFHPSIHGNLRRQQRNIGIRDLQAAKKHGLLKRGYPDPRTGNPRSIYTYRGLCYIVDDVTGREITSFFLPTTLTKEPLSMEQQWQHDVAQTELNHVSSCCKSHTVFLVDKSGSMRLTDVADSRSRFHSVWVALAEDFIRHRIETGQATVHDAVSIILFGSDTHVLVNCVPTDWVLYNILVDVYYGRCSSKSIKKKVITPSGHGFYLPALKLAQTLLEKTAQVSSATLSLAILSDGRPSDFNGHWVSARKHILECVENIASRFGKRLSVHGIGMGASDKFEILREVTTVVKDYSCEGEFTVPSLSVAGLGKAFSSLATSIAESQQSLLTGTEGGLKTRPMRQVTREKASNVPFFTEVVDSDEFNIYMGTNVSRAVYKKQSRTFEFAPLQDKDACGVAIKKVAFGEGGERLAFQFFEVATDGTTVVGEALVAKLSRFIEDCERDFPDIEAEADENGLISRWAARDRFVRKFCERQNVAFSIAEEFNKKLDLIKRLDPDTPRVTFLECSVYYVQQDGGAESALLVEKKLDGKFSKWNGNNGFVNLSQFPEQKLGKRRRTMYSIPEEDDVIIIDVDTETLKGNDCIFFSASEVAQAFSHFSLHHSEGRMIICDLQGEYDKSKKMLRFTDPVIHYHDRQNPGKRNNYGRTDFGWKGIDKFMDNHQCNQLCGLVNRGFRSCRPQQAGDDRKRCKQR